MQLLLDDEVLGLAVDNEDSSKELVKLLVLVCECVEVEL